MAAAAEWHDPRWAEHRVRHARQQHVDAAHDPDPYVVAALRRRAYLQLADCYRRRASAPTEHDALHVDDLLAYADRLDELIAETDERMRQLLAASTSPLIGANC